ncbi:MAG: hypothetical protein ACFFF4_07720 [Candidatus Thorarchaeota archaeon]
MTDFTGLRFIGIYPQITCDDNFIVRDLPGSGKRIDVLCRSLSACFDWAPTPTMREKLEYVAILSHSFYLHFVAPKGTYGKGETWWAESIRNSMRGAPPDNIEIKEMSIELALEGLLKENPSMFVLDGDGQALADISLSPGASQYSFMLGNHLGFDERTVQIINEMDIQKVSLGQRSYLGSHCVAAIISHFERNGI